MLPTRGVWLPALPSWHCHDRREENKHLYLHPEGGKETNIHSLELTWKWKMAPWKTIILYNQGIVDFHVNSREGNYNGNHTREAPPQLQALEAPARHTSPGSRLSVESSPVERRLSNGGPGGGHLGLQEWCKGALGTETDSNLGYANWKMPNVPAATNC